MTITQLLLLLLLLSYYDYDYDHCGYYCLASSRCHAMAARPWVPWLPPGAAHRLALAKWVGIGKGRVAHAK